MKRYRWMILLLAITMMTGCQKEKQDLPLVQEDMQPDEDDEVVEDPEITDEPVMEYEVDLPEALSSFTFGIWGEKYQLPITYEEFTKLGWEYQGDTDSLIEAEAYVEDEEFIQNECKITVDMINPSSEAKTVSECYVGGVKLDLTLRENAGMTVHLPGSLVGLYTVKEEVIEHYGTPKDVYEEDGMIYLTYEYGLYRKAMLGFRAEDQTLAVIELQNYRSSDEDMEPEDISKEVPEEVKQYLEPEGLGSTLKDCIVDYADHFYRLPAPVRCFLDHGWEILEEESDSWVKGGSYGYITLTKEKQKVYVVVYNYSEYTVEVSNCFVTTLYGDLDTTKVPIRVAGDITLGMGEEEFLVAAKEQSYEKDEKDGKIVYTFYMNEEDQKDYTEITVDSDLKLVRGIKVVHNREESPQENPAADFSEQSGEQE